ncbi:MAG: hypothetical protein HYX22_01820 [Candidatus Yanofskybacteria bacterium]|nr:hypothetical protein [Candidatus Yanofskybacteria bacterium]
MARTSMRDSVILYLMEASLKELEYMENLIKTAKTVKILRTIKTLKAGSGKTKRFQELYEKLPSEKRDWVESEVKKELARIKAAVR